jgi:hypothetical protein
MEVCFVLNHVIIVDPKLKQNPDVLFLSAALPAQSEFVHPYILPPSPPRYLRPYSIVPLKYLSTCFVATQCTSLGSTINWLKLFIAKHIFGRVLTKYIKDPIICLYNLGSTNSKYEVTTFFMLVIIGVAIGLQSSIMNLLRISIVYFS